MARIKGKFIVLFLGNNAIAMGTSCDLDVQRDMVEKSNASSGASKEYRPGRYGWTVSAEGLVAADMSNVDDLLSKLKAGTAVSVAIGKASWSGTTATKVSVHTGYAYIESFRQTAGTTENARFSCQLRGTGDLV